MDGMAALMAVARTMRVSYRPESEAMLPLPQIVQSLAQCIADCAETPPED
jgi:hypothetical protein